jgi:hypothetical protein
MLGILYNLDITDITAENYNSWHLGEIFIFQPIRNWQIVFSRARVDEQTFAAPFLLENCFRSWYRDFSMLHSGPHTPPGHTHVLRAYKDYKGH